MSRFLKHHRLHQPSIELSEQNGIRSLHLGNFMVQSAMKLSAPNDLELIYTQYMMGFLLFHPNPKHILMIGLGGGSIAKFIYQQMPQTQITAVEIHPLVVTIARNYFFLPDDERLQVIIAEGGQYITDHSGMDVLLIDGFDHDCQPASLCSQEFYDKAYSKLNKKGILVVNLLSRDKHVNNYLKRIKNSFHGHVAAIMTGERGNLIVFAFKNSPGKLVWKTLKKHAKTLENHFSLPLSEVVTKLHKYNAPHSHSIEI